MCITGVGSCTANPCFYGGTCATQDGGYTCTCRPGYSGTNCATITTSKHAKKIDLKERYTNIDCHEGSMVNIMTNGYCFFSIVRTDTFLSPQILYPKPNPNLNPNTNLDPHPLPASNPNPWSLRMRKQRLNTWGLTMVIIGVIGNYRPEVISNHASRDEGLFEFTEDLHLLYNLTKS